MLRRFRNDTEIRHLLEMPAVMRDQWEVVTQCGRGDPSVAWIDRAAGDRRHLRPSPSQRIVEIVHPVTCEVSTESVASSRAPLASDRPPKEFGDGGKGDEQFVPVEVRAVHQPARVAL